MKHTFTLVLLLVCISCNVPQKQPKKPATYSITFRPPTKKESRMIDRAMGSYTPRYVVEDIFAEKPTKFKGKEVRDSNGICCVLVPLDKADSIKLELEPKKAEGDLILKSTGPTTKGKVYLGEGAEVDSAYLSKHNIVLAQPTIVMPRMKGTIQYDWGDNFVEGGWHNLDTVPVIMLCADTSLEAARSPEEWVYKYNAGVVWMEGYEVRGYKTVTMNDNNTVYAVGKLKSTKIYTHLNFLDKEKKSLEKGIMVWDHRFKATN